MSVTLDDHRRKAADELFRSYDFDLQVLDMNGWESENPGTEWTRTVFFENDEGPESPSLKGSYTVVFEDENSAVVVEDYGMLNGDVIGNSMRSTTAKPSFR